MMVILATVETVRKQMKQAGDVCLQNTEGIFMVTKFSLHENDLGKNWPWLTRKYKKAHSIARRLTKVFTPSSTIWEVTRLKTWQVEYFTRSCSSVCGWQLSNNDNSKRKLRENSGKIDVRWISGPPLVKSLLGAFFPADYDHCIQYILNQNSIRRQVINKWLSKPALSIYAKLCKNMQRIQGYTQFQVGTCARPPPTAYPSPRRLGMQLWRQHSPRIPWCNLWGQSLWMSCWCQARVCINGVKLAIWMTVTPNRNKTKYKDILSEL